MKTHNPMDTADNLEIQQKDEEKQEEERQQCITDLHWLMGGKIGRRFVYRFLSEAGVFNISFNTNALTMAFQEGNRNAGLKLLNDLMTYCPDLYAKAQKEHKKDG